MFENLQVALGRLAELMEAERKALYSDSMNTILTIDAEIERSFGEKERAMGAFYQHRKEHGC